ncbi:hypothetical protein CRV24_008752 [Beauveria bassiana]|nr:hypothetical protein CRV24_008752 [Beauveria bassiana]KAH8715289.1 hypothetical protein HC256_004125 [Beauveria bassiana]
MSHYRFYKPKPAGGASSDMARLTEVTPVAPVGPVLETLSRIDFLRDSMKAKTARITDCETIASFNWLGERDAHIVVPGCGHETNPSLGPCKLKEDDGVYYRDRNAAQYPDFPVEPTVESILRMASRAGASIATGEIDIFGCGSTLGNLLRFILGDRLTFRILIEVLGTTVHFIRREKSPQETIPDVRGYGHSFPENYTTWDPAVRGSSSHQRVIKYRFGGLGCLVRFEGDGYLPDKLGTLARKSKRGIDETRPMEKEDYRSPEELFSSLAVSHETSSSSKSGIKITNAGYVVPQRAIFDLKTRSVKRKHQEREIITGEMPRLWLRQIPTLVLAYHSSGFFNDIKIRDVRTGVANWEKQNADSLASFAELLGKIVKFARHKQDGRLEITCNEGDNFLLLRAQTTDIRPAFTPLTGARWRAWLMKGSSDGTETRKDAQAKHYSFGVSNAPDDSRVNAEDLYNDEGVSIDYAACDEECGYCGHCL